MGAETVRAVAASDDVTLVGATCNTPRGDLLPTPAGEVMVEFTHAEACMEAAPLAANRGIHMVLGASGLNADQLQTLDTMSREHGVGVIVAPNFALGAVVLKKLAEQAAAFFDYVDVVEAHHEMKIDAPSGFSLAIARGVRDARGSDFQRNETTVHHLPETRGGDVGGVSIHSLRLPGRSAHHEVIFGAAGQTLSIRHDTLGRDCYMPGVLRCVREVVHRPGLTVGLEAVLGL
ncbi:4-hydroxy-tetrahydrodipicolinate reductase [Geodia barretti]|uniref:4-hydroxy-tetrahydrodipicolinate reductase n=1 Tax=Geodia barretti TaxID=519541 RepID=A0AA35RWE1_GEOBA|nr:4-hydroxy-tetrahydrodipicolinate reductase [Geodia barretti]